MAPADARLETVKSPDESHSNELGWAGLALTLFAINIAVFPLGAQSKWPPGNAPGRFVIEICAAALAWFCLWRSGESKIAGKIGYGVLIVAALLFLTVPIPFAIGERDGMDYLTISAITISLMIGGWRSGQRWLTLALLGIAIFLFLTLR